MAGFFMIEISKIKCLLSYNAETGLLTWNQAPSPKVKIGDVAGTITKQGYIRITILNNRLMAHRLAFAIYHGRWPDNQIDHINGLKHDNRISNLRECTPEQNMHNRSAYRINKTGFKGVYQPKNGKRFVAQIRNGGKAHYLGAFDSAKEASAAYAEAANALHGEFARQ
jgi:hypothetical protein